MGKVVTPDKQQHYLKLRREGWPMLTACREVGVSRDWAYRFEKGHGTSGGIIAQIREARDIPGPIPHDKLCEEAKRGLEDFEFFRRFYLGHVSVPWQVETAEMLIGLLASPEKEFVVENCPPGVGKTTLIHDIACWATARNRRLRGLIGSRKAGNADRMLARVKRSLERVTPSRAPTELIDMGLAVDAKATLAQHYGSFKPPPNFDVWRSTEFVVAQLDDVAVEEKEPTWSSYGVDSGVLSNRFDFIFWDDLVDRTSTRTLDAAESLQVLWDMELENRLEPRGLLVLLGQRLEVFDLYRYNIDKSVVVEEADGGGAMYRHIRYRAHDEERCSGVHKPGLARPQPDGCLLDPDRLPWRDCLKVQGTKRRAWEISYQQEDAAPDEVLVPKLWVDGGRGTDGVEYPGCWDRERGVCEFPVGLSEPCFSVVSADPSPTRFWSVQWWLFNQPSELRYLLDHERRVMDAPDFLDFDPVSGMYTGLLEDWWIRSMELGRPFRWLIVEANAAQRFMLQYTHFRRWAALRKVNLIPHQTTRNKLDPDFGVVASLKPAWRHGRVRLPGRSGLDQSRMVSMKLVDEVTRWPGASTDDCVMAQWFFEYHLPRIAVPDRSRQPRKWRPTWWRSESVGVAG